MQGADFCKHDLATLAPTGIIAAPLKRMEKSEAVAIDEMDLTRGRAAAEPKLDPVAVKIEETLAGFASDRTFNSGNCVYKIRRSRSKGALGIVATKNERSGR